MEDELVVLRMFGLIKTHQMRSKETQMQLLTAVLVCMTSCLMLAFASRALRMMEQVVAANILLLANIVLTLFLLLRLINTTLITYLLMPAQLISTHFASSHHRTIASFILSHHPHAKLVRIPSVGTTLEALEMINPLTLELPSERRPWILFLSANGTSLVDQLNFAVRLCSNLQSHHVPCNFMCLNFRGVGASGGVVLSASDLVSDVLAAFQFLMAQHSAHPDKILILGHSIGGAVGVAVRALYPTGPVIANRTFASLQSVVKDKLQIFVISVFAGVVLMVGVVTCVLCVVRLCGVGISPCGVALPALMGAAAVFLCSKPPLDSLPVRHMIALIITAVLAGMVGVWVGLMPRSGLFADFLLAVESVFGGVVSGVVCGALRWSCAPVLWILNLMGWKLDVTAAWRDCLEAKKGLVVHTRDRMIPASTSLVIASVYSSTASDSSGASPNIVWLSGNGNGHMYDLGTHPDEWITFVKMVKDIINAPTTTATTTATATANSPASTTTTSGNNNPSSGAGNSANCGNGLEGSSSVVVVGPSTSTPSTPTAASAATATTIPPIPSTPTMSPTHTSSSLVSSNISSVLSVGNSNLSCGNLAGTSNVGGKQ